MFEGLESRDKDPRRSLHLDEVPVPEVGPNEALVGVMASCINFNTVWTSIFEPLPTFQFLERAAKRSPWDQRHDLPYHIIGSDASGVILAVGPGVTLFKPGDEVTIHCNYVDMQAPDGHDDSMLDPDQRIWGFETNFGGLAEVALVRANQLMPKPPHLTWEEAASMPLVNSTAYRMLVSHNGTQIKQGDIVLIWGAVGGLGGFALQYALNAGAFPICVVSSSEKAKLCETIGARWVIDRNAEGYRFWNEDGTQNVRELRRFGKKIRELTGGEDPDVVYEHPGRETFARQRVRRSTGRPDRHLRLHLGLQPRVRQPLPVDEQEAHHRLALRQLPRSLGGESPGLQAGDPPPALRDLAAGRNRRGGLPRSPQSGDRQDRRPVSGAEEGLGSERRGGARPPHRADQPLPQRR